MNFIPPSSRVLGFLFAVVLLPALTAQGPNAAYRPETGQIHADFSLPSIRDAKKISLSDFLGKKVLLLHFASW